MTEQDKEATSHNMDKQKEQTTTTMKPGRAVLFGCLTIFAIFALLELSLRLLAVGKALAEERTVVNVQSKYVDHPFLTSTMRPNYREVIPGHPSGSDLILETNSLGFRGPEFEVGKEPGVYRIVVVGGSAVMAGSTEDKMFTTMLEEMLTEHFEGVPFEVINAGVPGFTSTQELFLIETQILDWNPDLVLIYDGRNDMHQASMPDYIPYWTQRNQEVITYLEGGEDVLRRHIFTWELLSRYVFRVERYPERDYGNASRGVRHAYTAHEEALDVYAHNLETAIIVLQGYDVQPALAFQPALATTAKPLSEREQAVADKVDDNYAAAIRELLPQAAEHLGQVAERHDVPWVDLTGVFDGQDEMMFIDNVHQSDAGNVLIAQALCEMLEPVIRADLGR